MKAALYFFQIIRLLSGYDIYRDIEDLRHFENGVNVSSCSGRKMMGGAALAPAVYKLPCSAGKPGSHIGIAEGKNLSFLVHTFSHDKLKVSVAVLGDREICNRACLRIELRQISAAGLAV